MQKMIESWKSTFRQYAKCSGRATRHEYWTWVLGFVVISFGLGLVEAMLGLWPDSGSSVLAGVFTLIVFIPSIAVACRRLQDTGKNGWLILLGLIPVVGGIILLVFFLQPSQPGTNAYGPNPHGA